MECDLRDVRRALYSGRCEVAVTYDLELDESTRRVQLAKLPPYVLLSVKHRLARRRTLSLRDLANEPLILESLPITRDYFLSLFHRTKITPTIKQYVESFEMQRGLVALGYGIALACTRPVGDISYDGTRFKCIPLGGKIPPPLVVAACRDDAKLTIVADRFIQYAQSQT